MDPLSRFLEQFPDAQPHGHYWTAHCPGHEDNRRSLSISTGADGRVLLHCHAGCDPARVIAPLSIPMADLFPSSSDPDRQRSEPEITYDYRDERGELIFQKQRFPGKRFLIRRPEGSGWVTRQVFEGGVRRVLYRLPDLLKEDRDLIFICEGEKDADRLWREGLAATTNYEGAGEAQTKSKWRDEYSVWLRDTFPATRFLCLPDNDSAGKGHMASVAASLTSHGLSATVLELPGLAEKGDVSDWFNAGGTAAQLLKLCEPPVDPLDACLYTAAALLAADLLEPEWLVPGLVAKAVVTMLAGQGKLGKSALAHQLCLSLASGGQFLGKPLPASGVLYVNWEDPLGLTRRRALQQMEPDVLPDLYHVLKPPWGTSFNRFLSWLRKRLPDLGIQLVVVDPLALAAGWEDENDPTMTGRTMRDLQEIAEETGAAVIPVHHTKKAGGEFGAEVRGSGAIFNGLQGFLSLRRRSERGEFQLDVLNKLADGDEVQYLLRREPRTLTWHVTESLDGEGRKVHKATAGRDATADDLLILLRQMPASTGSALAAAADIPESTVRRYLRLLSDEGRVTWTKEVPKGGRGRPSFRFFAEPEQERGEWWS